MSRIYGTFDNSESHKKEIKGSHQYKDYLERHPKTKEILGKKKEVAGKMKTVKDLKQMISEPASKEWFAKHGK